eukprot:GHVR01045845.1.p1 GENE.GHVR01045845.1~~GHVR01045845.1.p1  ORF type:complete len:132 (-),score=17.19 GHVR01045845.1:299-694(-)
MNTQKVSASKAAEVIDPKFRKVWFFAEGLPLVYDDGGRVTETDYNTWCRDYCPNFDIIYDNSTYEIISRGKDGQKDEIMKLSKNDIEIVITDNLVTKLNKVLRELRRKLRDDIHNLRNDAVSGAFQSNEKY